MSKLPDETNDLLLLFFVKLHLVECLLIMIVLFLIPTSSHASDTYKFTRFKICMENFHIEVELMKSIFKCNNYPVNIIDQCIKKFFDKLYVPKQIVPTVPKKELLVVLPYLGTFSLNLRKLLYQSVSNSLPQSNIKVIFQSKNRLSSSFKFKGFIPLHLRSLLIYKFQCSNCNITYYGET